MPIPMTAPGLFFPAISLMMLAQTNRFLALASLIRSLKDRFKNEGEQHIIAQLKNLRKRMKLIRAMQIFGLLSFLLCSICIFLIMKEWDMAAELVFMTSIVAFTVSLFLSLLEIILSLEALEEEISDVEELSRRRANKPGNNN